MDFLQQHIINSYLLIDDYTICTCEFINILFSTSILINLHTKYKVSKSYVLPFTSFDDGQIMPPFEPHDFHV